LIAASTLIFLPGLFVLGAGFFDSLEPLSLLEESPAVVEADCSFLSVAEGVATGFSSGDEAGLDASGVMSVDAAGFSSVAGDGAGEGDSSCANAAALRHRAVLADKIEISNFIAAFLSWVAPERGAAEPLPFWRTSGPESIPPTCVLSADHIGAGLSWSRFMKIARLNLFSQGAPCPIIKIDGRHGRAGEDCGDEIAEFPIATAARKWHWE
jgi:hypothetical protein